MTTLKINVMKIAVLGATGPSGVQVVQQSLKRGHEVIALVRNPSKITQQHEKLQVVKADIFSGEELTQHFSGCDVVMSCIGGGVTVSAVTLYSDNIKVVTDAMRAVGINRFICISSWYSKSTSAEPFFWKWMVRPIIGRLLSDMDRMETYLMERCSDIDYTVVRPPQLTNDTREDKELFVEEALWAKDTAYKIPRANVASFMIDCMEQEQYKKKMVSIGLKK